MNPWIHAKNSANRFGGVPEDYLEVHQFMDSAKEGMATIAHRLLLHNSFGVVLAEKVCGELIVKPDGKPARTPYITNSNGEKVFIRDIAQQHIMDDLSGKIPTLFECFGWIKPEMVPEKLGVFDVVIRQARKFLAEQEAAAKTSPISTNSQPPSQ
jgi:hypothetical protein